MKTTMQQPLKWKWAGPIDKSEIPLGILIISVKVLYYMFGG